MGVCDECPVSHHKNERGTAGKLWFCPLTGERLWEYTTGAGLHPIMPTITEEWFVGPGSCLYAPILKALSGASDAQIRLVGMILSIKPRLLLLVQRELETLTERLRIIIMDNAFGKEGGGDSECPM